MNSKVAKTVKTGLVWFRQDLRVSDNPALHHAARDCDRLLLVFIDDPHDQSASQIGAASRAWLHYSLASLAERLEGKGGVLLFRKGHSLECLSELISDADVTDVYWNRCYDPVTIKRDKSIKQSLQETVNVNSFNSLLIVEPWQNCKDDQSPYRVFTPFWNKMALNLPGEAPLPAPRRLPAAVPMQETCRLQDLDLLPQIDWHSDMLAFWDVGEQSAQRALKAYARKSVDNYAEERNIPGVRGTSRLSPHLHFGEISPRQVMHHLYKHCLDVTEKNSGANTYAKEIGWREFAYHLIYHFPETVAEPLDARFKTFPWAANSSANLVAWQKGMTGVPIVDAGMRELWQTGWMHNRVRMIVASYLVKNLLIPWQSGERWFRDTLVDADMASNVMGWQWTAGCGADAAPYFRVFNPVLQGEKFDKQGDYIRRWVPELDNVENKFIHKPWELPGLLFKALDYPEPLVDLKESRVRSLAAFDKVKAGSRH